MAIICANPYDINASYFYFSSAEEYERKYKAHLPVEEYEFFIVDGSEFEFFMAENLLDGEPNNFKKFFELVEEHQNSMTEEKLVALEYLVEYENCDAINAFDKIDDVMVLEGNAEDYAREIYQDEIEAKIGNLAFYFDYEFLGRDLVLGGDIFEYKREYKKYIITS